MTASKAPRTNVCTLNHKKTVVGLTIDLGMLYIHTLTLNPWINGACVTVLSMRVTARYCSRCSSCRWADARPGWLSNSNTKFLQLGDAKARVGRTLFSVLKVQCNDNYSHFGNGRRWNNCRWLVTLPETKSPGMSQSLVFLTRSYCPCPLGHPVCGSCRAFAMSNSKVQWESKTHGTRHRATQK